MEWILNRTKDLGSMKAFSFSKAKEPKFLSWWTSQLWKWRSLATFLTDRILKFIILTERDNINTYILEELVLDFISNACESIISSCTSNKGGMSFFMDPWLMKVENLGKPSHWWDCQVYDSWNLTEIVYMYTSSQSLSSNILTVALKRKERECSGIKVLPRCCSHHKPPLNARAK